MNKKLAYFGLGIICTILVASLFTFASAKLTWPWQKDNPDLSPPINTDVSLKCPYGSTGQTKEIEEKSLEIVNGLSLAVNNASESSFELTSSLIPQAGSVLLSNEINATDFSIININGEAFRLTLLSASDTSATIKLTDSRGNSEINEINEGESEKIGKLSILVVKSDESSLVEKALIIPGLVEFTLTTRGIGRNIKRVNGVDFEYRVELVSARTTSATIKVTCKRI